MRSFADPETHFTLLTSETTDRDGGEGRCQLTGEVMCDECGRVAGAIEYIPHAPNCPQADVKSGWWAMTHAQALQETPTAAEDIDLGSGIESTDENLEAGAD